MKRLIILFFVLIPFISGCNKENNDELLSQVREVAWSSLSTLDRSTVTVDWKVAPVKEAIYQGKSTYAVIFNTSDEALLGPITVYVDKSSLVVLGRALRM